MIQSLGFMITAQSINSEAQQLTGAGHFSILYVSNLATVDKLILKV
jgi:hypothetical protein